MKTSGLNDFTEELFQMFKEELRQPLHILFHKTQMKEDLLIHFTNPILSRYQNHIKDSRNIL